MAVNASCDLPDSQALTVESLVGSWRTRFGIYTIYRLESGELVFEENSLRGVLKHDGEWYEAQIKDSTGKMFGVLRLKPFDDKICSTFKHSPTQPWDELGDILASPLPIKRVEAPSQQSSCFKETHCCICMEEFTSESDLSMLQCQHRFHRSCIQEWFLRSNQCPMRCT